MALDMVCDEDAAHKPVMCDCVQVYVLLVYASPHILKWLLQFPHRSQQILELPLHSSCQSAVLSAR